MAAIRTRARQLLRHRAAGRWRTEDQEELAGEWELTAQVMEELLCGPDEPGGLEDADDPGGQEDVDDPGPGRRRLRREGPQESAGPDEEDDTVEEGGPGDGGDEDGERDNDGVE